MLPWRVVDGEWLLVALLLARNCRLVDPSPRASRISRRSCSRVCSSDIRVGWRRDIASDLLPPTQWISISLWSLWSLVSYQCMISFGRCCQRVGSALGSAVKRVQNASIYNQVSLGQNNSAIKCTSRASIPAQQSIVQTRTARMLWNPGMKPGE